METTRLRRKCRCGGEIEIEVPRNGIHTLEDITKIADEWAATHTGGDCLA